MLLPSKIVKLELSDIYLMVNEQALSQGDSFSPLPREESQKESQKHITQNRLYSSGGIERVVNHQVKKGDVLCFVLFYLFIFLNRKIASKLLVAEISVITTRTLLFLQKSKYRTSA